jgi:hypothetical protein
MPFPAPLFPFWVNANFTTQAESNPVCHSDRLCHQAACHLTEAASPGSTSVPFMQVLRLLDRLRASRRQFKYEPIGPVGAHLELRQNE